MASISTAAPAGRLAAPTAARVWRPLSPSPFAYGQTLPERAGNDRAIGLPGNLARNEKQIAA
jgi:hypothetical protein